MNTCRTCLNPSKPLRKGECAACSVYRRNHGVTRPSRFFERATSCAVRECQRKPGSISGLCRLHYCRKQRTGDPEKCLKSFEYHGHAKHNNKPSITYRSWASMRRRCLNPNVSQYQAYGGAGVKICDRWHSFSTFLADMGERPSLNHTIDRYPDKSGDYEPGNCRWATPEQQQNNKRSNRLIEHQGQTLSVAQWSRLTGIAKSTLRNRLERGWSNEITLTREPDPRRLVC
jgi:hypothetical protein